MPHNLASLAVQMGQLGKCHGLVTPGAREIPVVLVHATTCLTSPDLFGRAHALHVIHAQPPARRPGVECLGRPLNRQQPPSGQAPSL